MAAAFTPNDYAELLSALLEKGYEVKSFGDADPQKQHLVLRHDIDFSMQAALILAQVEQELGLYSSYFILMQSEFYNVLSRASLDCVRKLQDMGHSVELHLDAAAYADEAELEAGAAKELSILHAITGTDSEVISFHRPHKRLLGKEDRIAGRLHTYQPRFFTEMGYCSDSRGGWYHGHPLDHPSVAQGRALQLLTHPVWWTLPAGEATAKLKRFLLERYQLLDEELASQCQIHHSGNLRRLLLL